METAPRALSGRLSGESEHADAAGVLGTAEARGYKHHAVLEPTSRTSALL